MQSRPYLGWLRSLAEASYLEAAQEAHKFCNGEGGEKQSGDKRAKGAPLDLATTKTVLSIGKLCGWVNMLDMASDQPEATTSIDIVEAMDKALLAVRAQECIARYAETMDRYCS